MGLSTMEPARMRMKLEPVFWNSYKDGKGYKKIFQLIDTAILVLALEKPDEFLERRSHILDVLFKNHREALSQQPKAPSSQSQLKSILSVDSSGGVKLQQQQQQESCHSHHHRIRIKLKGRPKVAAGNTDDGQKTRVQEQSSKKPAVSSCLDQGAAFAIKLQATKRKLHELYQDAQNSRRKVQLIDLQDLPPPQQPFSGFKTKPTRIPQIRSR